MQSVAPRDTRWIDDPVYGLSAMDLDSPQQSHSMTLSSRQLYILRAIAISAASMSMVSGILVGWWFVRMKRSFRHHLIMLMIFSDFFKASWQLIYPAVVFSQGAVTSQSRFCQTAGFMMSMGIEASDFAVLAIAVHSALYIFRPGMGAIGEGGLFRYRYYVYVLWLGFAIIMPSLAFVNKHPAYTAQGTFCYLPVRPFWFRLALAWIPRYLILLTILTLYAGIFFYVRMKFRTFRTNVGASTLDADTVDLHPADAPPNLPPRLPSLDAHGLIPPSPCPAPVDSRHASDKSDQPFAKAFLAPLTSLNDRTRASSSANSQNDSRRESGLFAGDLPSSFGDRASTDKRRRQKNETANEEARRRRIAISRQLRLLFIYPLVYALMWMPPLFGHALQFTDRFATNPNFPLQCVIAFTLPFQCFVDCWLFTIREKPWRYIPTTKGGSWAERHGFSTRKCKGKSAVVGAEEGGDDSWRTRKHMSYDARRAYERRDQEKFEAAKEWMSREDLPPQRREEVNWWDTVERGIDEEYENYDPDAMSISSSTAPDELSRIENGFPESPS